MGMIEVTEIIKLAEGLKLHHLRWCRGRRVCGCGVSEHNAKVDKLIEYIYASLPLTDS